MRATHMTVTVTIEYDTGEVETDTWTGEPDACMFDLHVSPHYKRRVIPGEMHYDQEYTGRDAIEIRMHNALHSTNTKDAP